MTGGTQLTLSRIVLLASLLCQAFAQSPSPVKQATPRIRQDTVSNDFTYFRTRATLKYDWQQFQDGSIFNEVRLRGLYAFGEQGRWAATIQVPVLTTLAPPGQSTSVGIGDIDLQAGVIFQENHRFKQGIGVQGTVPTANVLVSYPAAKLIYGTSFVQSDRWFFTSRLTLARFFPRSATAANYNELELEGTVSHPFLGGTIFLHSDNYYDSPPSQWGDTLQPGLARSFGKRKLWTGTLFYQFALNEHARQVYRHDIGFEITRFFGH